MRASVRIVKKFVKKLPRTFRPKERHGNLPGLLATARNGVVWRHTHLGVTQIRLERETGKG
jgi:hypothetical protein